MLKAGVHSAGVGAMTERSKTFLLVWAVVVGVLAVLLLVLLLAAMAVRAAGSSGQGESSGGGSSARQDYLDSLSGQNIVGYYDTEYQAVSDGYEVCADLDGGRDPYSITTDFTEFMTDYDSGWIVGSAMTHLCPEYQYLLPE